MRFLVLLLVISAATTGFAASQRAADDAALFDSIVTGKRITTEQKAHWLEQKKRAEECPACALAQPFPGDD